MFEHEEAGIASALWVYVALDAPVKYLVLKLHNRTEQARRLSVTGYVEWVLGDLRPKSALHIVTEIDPSSGALLARNPYNSEFADRLAFFDSNDPSRTLSGDRAEFIGRNGRLSQPDALTRTRLSGRVGAALDACGALQSRVDLAPDQTQEIVFRLGVLDRRGVEEAGLLMPAQRGAMAARAALAAVQAYWTRTLGAVQVETPDPAFDRLANGWLLYQTLACRIWARSGDYQSGGAFGFRDQLQETRLGAVRPDQPHPPWSHPGADRHLQGRALCHGRRCLWRCAPYRSRRLDLVHRLSGLDVSADARIPARAADRRRHPAPRTLPAARLAGL